MEMNTMLTIVVAIFLGVEGVFGLITGKFISRYNQPVKHEPIAYSKWTRLFSACLIVISVLCIIWLLPEVLGFDLDGQVYFVLAIVMFALILFGCVSYFIIVKPADKKYKK